MSRALRYTVKRREFAGVFQNRYGSGMSWSRWKSVEGRIKTLEEAIQKADAVFARGGLIKVRVEIGGVVKYSRGD